MSAPPEVVLHRHWLWANRFRTLFDEELKKGQTDWSKSVFADSGLIFMCLWYSFLYVTIEGWRELKLSEPTIDALLASDKVDLLRRLRNATCHFQEDFVDQRFFDFMADEDTAEWTRALNKEFGRFFLDWYKRNSPSATS